MDLFGFEEDLDLCSSQGSQILATNAVSKPVAEIIPRNDEQKLTISQIQDLLLKDLVDETTTDQDTFHESETSIFEESTNSLPPEAPKPRPRRAVKKAVKNDENTTCVESETTVSELEAPKLRPRRAAKKVLQSIENTSYEATENTTQSEFLMPVTCAYTKPNRRKKVLQSIENTHADDPLNSSSTKNKRNPRKKTKTKNDENEHVESIAQEINNKFKEVEEYRLVVE